MTYLAHTEKLLWHVSVLVVLSSFGFAQTLINRHELDCSAEGCEPTNPSVMAQGPDGNLYGTTPRAGTHALGTVFKVTPVGQMTTLYNFSGPDGANPQGGLTLGPDGNFYGTPFAGGPKWPRQAGKGVIFKITPSGVLTVIHTFPTQIGADGINPYSAPTLG